MKILPSPGLSSRPLTAFERARELWRDVFLRQEWDLIRVWAHVRNFFLYGRFSRNGRNLRKLVKALEAGSWEPAPLAFGAPLKVESLEATMACVTYNESSIKLVRRARAIKRLRAIFPEPFPSSILAAPGRKEAK